MSRQEKRIARLRAKRDKLREQAAAGNKRAARKLKKLEQGGGFPWGALLGLLVGACVVSAPIVTDWYTTWQAEQVISTLEDTVDVSKDPERLRYLEQARAYNKALVGKPYKEPDGGLLPYDDQLSWKGKPYMAYLQIPKSSIKVPVYHGTADEELAMGAGHLERTSLPVGGKPTLCVLEGHSGMVTSRMFDDIRLLDENDMFCVWTLSEPYAYRVYKWEILDPEDVPEKLDLRKNADRCVLITCTTDPDWANPKGRTGINDKRLLVWGKRCKYDPDYFAEAPLPVQLATNSRTLPFIIALLVLLVVTIGCIVGYRKRKKAAKRKAETKAGEAGGEQTALEGASQPCETPEPSKPPEER